MRTLKAIAVLCWLAGWLVVSKDARAEYAHDVEGVEDGR
jgi:hypothetical protein